MVGNSRSSPERANPGSAALASLRNRGQGGQIALPVGCLRIQYPRILRQEDLGLGSGTDQTKAPKRDLLGERHAKGLGDGLRWKPVQDKEAYSFSETYSSPESCIYSP